MEFWGVEVKKGEPLKVMPGDGMVLHLSQACLGEQKKEKKESVCLFVEVDGKKLVIATLSTEKLPQQQFDLVFDRDFELTHNWKNGSVYFYGYKAPFGNDEPQPLSEFDSFESEEKIPLTVANNGKAKEKKPVQAETSNVKNKKESGSGKQKVQIVEPSKVEESDIDEDSGEDSDEDMSGDEDDSEDEDDEDADDSDNSEEETPKKAVPSKKRPAESTSKTPVADKKAKVTPQKTGLHVLDGKKANVHVATPHPAKQAKTPANKPNQQTPKSGGTHTCTSCNKAFGSDKALESHSKAKHAAN